MLHSCVIGYMMANLISQKDCLNLPAIRKSCLSDRLDFSSSLNVLYIAECGMTILVKALAGSLHTCVLLT